MRTLLNFNACKWQTVVFGIFYRENTRYQFRHYTCLALQMKAEHCSAAGGANQLR